MPRHRARIQTPAPTSLAPLEGEECSRGPPHETYRRIYAGGRATEPSEVLQEMGGEKGAQCPGEATAPWVRPDEGVGEKARGAHSNRGQKLRLLLVPDAMPGRGRRRLPRKVIPGVHGCIGWPL